MTTKKRGLLSNSIFEKPFMDSKANTEHVTTKEWVFGHLIGPLGLIFVVNTIAALVEKFNLPSKTEIDKQAMSISENTSGYL